MLLASALEPALMLEGMRAGCHRSSSPSRSNQADFDAAITRLLGQRKQVAGGPVFAFVGAKGGVGTTTTAVNVATVLAKLSKGPTLLVDLHLAYGDAAVFLGADARFSLLDALENMHRLDAEFLKSLVVKTALRPRAAGVRGPSGQPRWSTCGGSARSCSSPRLSTPTPSSTSRART